MEHVTNQKTRFDSIIKINIRNDSLKSIKQAEKDKFALECKGYNLIDQLNGFIESVMIYAK